MDDQTKEFFKGALYGSAGTLLIYSSINALDALSVGEKDHEAIDKVSGNLSLILQEHELKEKDIGETISKIVELKQELPQTYGTKITSIAGHLNARLILYTSKEQDNLRRAVTIARDELDDIYDKNGLDQVMAGSSLSLLAVFSVMGLYKMIKRYIK